MTVTHDAPPATTVFFFTHTGLIPQDAVFARAAREQRSLRSIAIVLGRLDRESAEREAAFDGVVDLIEGFGKERGRPPALDELLARLTDLERRAGDDLVSSAMIQDRWLGRVFDHERAIAYAGHVLDRLERLFSASPPRAAVGELTMFHHRLARMLLRGTAPYLYPIGSRFFERFYLDDSLYLEWRQCQELYEMYRGASPPDEAAAAAREVIEGIRSSGAEPAQFKHARPTFSPSAEPVWRKLDSERLKTNLRYWLKELPEADRNPRVMANPWDMLPTAKAGRWIKEYVRRRWLTTHLLHELPRGRRFATLFLHYQPEYTVDTVGYPYGDQAAWVRLVAQSLPADISLLVKEQPFMTGARALGFYQKIEALENVILLAPEVNGREAARRSAMVFTLSGTVAIEAMILGTPAVVFSPVFHSKFAGITRLTEPEKLRDVVAASGSWQHASDDECVAALGAMYECSRPGQLNSDLVQPSRFASTENTRALGQSFVALLDKNELP